MNIIIPPCEDDSEPPDEHPQCLVSPGEGGNNNFPLLPHSILTLLRKVKAKAPPKFKTRPGRGGLRSLISLQALPDDRYLLRRLAVLWKNSSLEYHRLSPGLLPKDGMMDVMTYTQAQSQASSVRRIIPPFNSVITIDKQMSEYPHIASEENACIPTIVITPPSDSDDASSIGYNTIPTPQVSANGIYLTVPEYDFQITKDWRGYGEQCNIRERRLESVDHAARNIYGAQLESHITKLIPNYAYFEDDEEEGIDLGPTWSG